METQQQSQTCWVSAAALTLRQLHERTRSARIKEHLPLDCPLVSQTQASFPSHAFFPLYIYLLTPVPRKRSTTEQTWLQALFGLLLFGFYWKHSRRYLPEVTPRAVLHGQEGNVVNQEVHLLGNFAGSDDVGMVQPKHTESWMKTLTPLLGE